MKPFILTQEQRASDKRQWTTEIPTEPGEYWCRRCNDDLDELVFVTQERGKLFAGTVATVEDVPLDKFCKPLGGRQEPVEWATCKPMPWVKSGN